MRLLSVFLTFRLRLTGRTLLIGASARKARLRTSTRRQVPSRSVAVRSLLTVLNCNTPIIMIEDASVVLLSVTRLSTSALSGRNAMFLTSDVLALLEDFIEVRVGRVLHVSGVGLL